MSTATANLAEELLEKSEALLAHLNSVADKKMYDDPFIEKVQVLIDERQTIIEKLQNDAVERNTELKVLISSYVPKELCSRITNMETEIASGLKMVFDNIQNARKLLQKKKSSTQRYRNPYANIERDGMFVDKRK